MFVTHQKCDYIRNCVNLQQSLPSSNQYIVYRISVSQGPIQQVTTPTQYSLQGFGGAPQGLNLSLQPAGPTHTMPIGPAQSTLNKAAPPFKPASQQQHSGSVTNQVKSPPQSGTPTSGFGGPATPTHSPSTKFGMPGQYQQQQSHPLSLSANTFQMAPQQPTQQMQQQQQSQQQQHKGFGNPMQKSGNQQTQQQQQQQYQTKVNTPFVGQPIQPSGTAFTVTLLRIQEITDYSLMLDKKVKHISKVQPGQSELSVYVGSSMFN